MSPIEEGTTRQYQALTTEIDPYDELPRARYREQIMKQNLSDIFSDTEFLRLEISPWTRRKIIHRMIFNLCARQASLEAHDDGQPPDWLREVTAEVIDRIESFPFICPWTERVRIAKRIIKEHGLLSTDSSSPSRDNVENLIRELKKRIVSTADIDPLPKRIKVTIDSLHELRLRQSQTSTQCEDPESSIDWAHTLLSDEWKPSTELTNEYFTSSSSSSAPSTQNRKRSHEFELIDALKRYKAANLPCSE
jgi:hypothetical protein